MSARRVFLRSRVGSAREPPPSGAREKKEGAGPASLASEPDVSPVAGIIIKYWQSTIDELQTTVNDLAADPDRYRQIYPLIRLAMPNNEKDPWTCRRE